MAFVNRSERKFESDKLSPTTIGPGEYSNSKEKEDARILHIYSNIYNHQAKLTPLETNVPFNSTGERESKMFKTNQNPGPGSYNINIPSEKKMKEKLPILTTKDEIVFVEENNNLVPKIKREKKGFLSSEKRFFEKENTNYNNSGYYINTEPNTNKFNYKSYFLNTKEKIHNNRYVKSNFNKDKEIIKSIPTIPDKNRGEFKIVNYIIEEIKKDSNSAKKQEEELGPGKYNIFPKWNSKSINWKYGYNKIPKNILYKNELISNFKEHIISNNKINLSVKLNSNKLKKYISNSELLSKDNNNNKNYTYKKNNSMRNQVFTRHIKDRKKYLSEPMNKQKKYNEIINQIKYKETPGPGFYNNNLNNINNTVIFNINRTQNFGSNTPKFSEISHDNTLIGPGSYFLEKNKYQPKIEANIHIKKPIKKINTNNDEGLFIQNYRMKNRYKYPGPGQYNIGKNFIKDEISNVKSFGILSQRFNNLNKQIGDNNDYYDEKINRQLYTKVNYKYEDKMNYKINKQLFELKREEENLKKKRRDKYMSKKSPGVGDYSPEFSTSISYNVKSRINTFRNNIAPFNIKNSRFTKYIKINYDKIIPGPGDYDVANAFDALNNGIKKGYINNKNISNHNNTGDNDLIKIKNSENIEIPGPGLYTPDDANSWNKKSFNVLFMDK